MFGSVDLALHRENAELRQKVADLSYGPGALNKMLQEVNDTGLTEVCQCSGCFVARRFSQLTKAELIKRLKKATNHRQCVLRKCLLWQCDRLGLTHGLCKYNDASDTEGEENQHEEDHGWDSVGARKNCHLVVVDEGLGLWHVVYGKKLVDVPLAVNPETEKLIQLFELLEFGEDFFIMDNTDYFTLADRRA
jgi:hypothetical protein